MPRSREELVGELHKLATWLPALHPDKVEEASAVIREAADLLDSLEEREEYRVVSTSSTQPAVPAPSKARGVK
jgi:hypothetical protein